MHKTPTFAEAERGHDTQPCTQFYLERLIPRATYYI